MIPFPKTLSSNEDPCIPTQYFSRLENLPIPEIKSPVSRLHAKSPISSMSNVISQKHQQKNTQQAFLTFMRKFVLLPDNYHCTWSEIFYTRLIRTKTVLAQEFISKLKTLLFRFAEKTDKKDHDKALNLMKYLNHHVQDIDNSLIGLSPNIEIVKEYKKFIAKRRKKDKKIRLRISTMSDDELRNQMEEWADEGEDKTFFLSSSKYYNLSNLESGDLVIVKIPSKKIKGDIYKLLRQELEIEKNTSFTILPDNPSKIKKDRIIIARYCKKEGEKINVWIDPSEKKTISLKLSRVYPFSKDMIEMLDSERTMKRLVCDDIDIMHGILMKIIGTKADEALKNQNVDFQLLEKVNSNNVSILDLTKIEKLSKSLENISKLSSFQEDLNKRISKELYSKLPNIVLRYVFQPSLYNIENTLSPVPYVAAAKNRINRYITLCSLALSDIYTEIEEIKNGTLKNRMARWWLDCIREHVHELLLKHNYNFGAVPDNYIENPPKDINEVKKNLELIQKFLNVSEDEYNLVILIVEPLKSIIYPNLEKFRLKLQTYLILFSKSSWLSVSKFNLSDYKIHLQDTYNSGILNDTEYESLQAVALDVEYIDEMIKLESEFGKTKKAELSNVVPVSGLALNYFHRLQMELKTILELFTPKKQKLLEEQEKQHQLEKKQSESESSETSLRPVLLFSHSKKIDRRAQFKRQKNILKDLRKSRAGLKVSHDPFQSKLSISLDDSTSDEISIDIIVHEEEEDDDEEEDTEMEMGRKRAYAIIGNTRPIFQNPKVEKDYQYLKKLMDSQESD